MHIHLLFSLVFKVFALDTRSQVFRLHINKAANSIECAY